MSPQLCKLIAKFHNVRIGGEALENTISLIVIHPKFNHRNTMNSDGPS